MSDRPKLNSEQLEIYKKIIEEEKNVFVTGSGGVGKSFLLKYLYEEMSIKKNTVLTSLTGISALILGGVTLHSYLGIGIGTGSFDNLVNKIRKSSYYLKRWRRLDVLIIDEVSMLSIELFEKLERMARELRNNCVRFGGIQLIFSGDFLQLPTVGSDNFCFESKLWKICIDEVIELHTIMRQTDGQFIRVLNKVRMGEIDDECYDILKSREISYPSDNLIIPTMLYSTNAKVDSLNMEYYNQLSGEEFKYTADYTWHKRCDKEIVQNSIRLPAEISLKIGSQVMFLVNEMPLVNGSRGVVTKFIEGYPEVLFANGYVQIITPHTLDHMIGDDIVMSYKQLPLRLAWAISIHKSQGCTLDVICVDMHNVFEYGQFYVALSRAKTLDGLYIRNLDFKRHYTNPKALEFYRK